jgi:hypothetical protein
MAGVGGLASLLVGFIGIRMLGQGALTLTATTSVTLWFDRRRGAAVGLTSAIGQALMSLAPLALAAGIPAFAPCRRPPPTACRCTGDPTPGRARS